MENILIWVIALVACIFLIVPIVVLGFFETIVLIAFLAIVMLFGKVKIKP